MNPGTEAKSKAIREAKRVLDSSGSDCCYTALTYDWFKKNGFHRLERGERQPFDHVRRCLGMETIGKQFMVADEDLCLDLCPNDDSQESWHCWITKANSPSLHPTHWIHTRSLQFAEEVVLMYEGLTGRRFGPKEWNRQKQPMPFFPSV